MNKLKKYTPYIKKIIGTTLLLGAVIYTGYSCSIMEKKNRGLKIFRG